MEFHGWNKVGAVEYTYLKKSPDGFMPVKFGSFSGKIWGGPYRNRPTDYFGVKMAGEVQSPCDVDIPTKDFSTPDPFRLKVGLLSVMLALFDGREVYVGCMGGSGRTGLFMAALAKVCNVPDPVAYVRRTYKASAVETREQAAYIEKLDVDGIRMAAFGYWKWKKGQVRSRSLFQKLCSFFRMG